MREEGVWFSSHVDGKKLFLGPKEAIRAQVTLGSDIMMAFDECPPWPCSRDVLEKESGADFAVGKDLSRRADGNEDKEPAVWNRARRGSGGFKEKSCLALREIGFDGYAIGG